MSLTYQRERIADVWDEAQPLLAHHWTEIAHYHDIPLDPDREGYEGIEALGMVRCYTARDATTLVGYVVFFVRPNLHYRSSVQAMQDVLFLLPQYRGRLAGVRLLRFAEQELAAEAVQVVYHHAKRTNQVGELLKRLGYDLIDEIYGKRLDKVKE